MVCPYCGSADRQVKAGTSDGSQRYKCTGCNRRYLGRCRERGYPEEVRRQAAALHQGGVRVREISRRLGVSAQTVSNWVRREARKDTPAAESEPTEGTGKRSPRKPRPTISDVAQRAGVSTSTVSNYLNSKGRMGDATHARIRNAMEELHFTPSALVRAIRHRRTHILGVVIFGLGGLDQHVGLSLTPPILTGINVGAEAVRHDILLYTSWPHGRSSHSGLDFLNGHVDGLVWVAPEMGEPALEQLAAAGLPVVALLTRHVPEGIGYVNADNIGAARVLVAHLVAQGHRHIAFAGPVQSSNFQDRRAGYRQGLADAGLAFRAALEVTTLTEHWPRAEYTRTLERWRMLAEPPTAVIMQSDGWAADMIEEARRQGLRVPEDIAVTGFDDIPDAARLSGGLTTIRQPFRQMGRAAVECLLALIEGEPAENCRRSLPTELIVRASTDASRHEG